MAQAFLRNRLPGLEEHLRPGRPRLFPPELVVQVKALACELPAAHGLPLSRWSAGPRSASPPVRLGRHHQRQHGLAVASSGRDSALVPPLGSFRATRSSPPRPAAFWICTPAWEDKPLQDDEFVISADEKTSIQARRRIHSTLASSAASRP